MSADHEHLGHVQAAEQVAKSGLLWKWVRYDGTIKLVRWDAAEQVFLRGSLNDWYHFLGTHPSSSRTVQDESFSARAMLLRID